MDDFSFLKSVCIGDGCLSLKKRKRKSDNHVSSWVYFQVSHCLRQTPWLVSKAKRISSILDRKLVLYGPYKHKLPDNRHTLQYRYTVSADKVLRPIYESLYSSGEKKLTANFLSDLKEEAVSILWQDDGGIYEEKGYLHGVLSLNCICPSQVNLVIDWIESVTGAKGSVRTDSNGRFSIRYSYESLLSLVPSIEPYVVQELAYKVCLDAEKRRLASLPKFVLEDDKVARVPDDLLPYVLEGRRYSPSCTDGKGAELEDKEPLG